MDCSRFYEVKIESFVKNRSFSLPDFSLTERKPMTSQPRKKARCFLYFGVLVMFVHRVEVFDKIWMVELEQGHEENIGNNNIILGSHLFVEFHSISFGGSFMNVIDNTILKWVVGNFIDLIALSPEKLGIVFDCVGRLDPAKVCRSTKEHYKKCNEDFLHYC